VSSRRIFLAAVQAHLPLAYRFDFFMHCDLLGYHRIFATTIPLSALTFLKYPLFVFPFADGRAHSSGAFNQKEHWTGWLLIRTFTIQEIMKVANT
jgi:hypothetical protein